MSISTGNINSKKIWELSFPVIISNISIPMLEATNTGIMGHLSNPAYIGGLALAITLTQFIYVSFNFLRMGTTGITAQAFGANNKHEIGMAFFRPLFFAIAFGVLITLLQYPISILAFKVFQGTDIVESLANEYFKVRINGAIFTFSNFVIIGWLLGIQKPKITLLLQVFMNGLNIFLSIFFVLGLGYGMKGAAFACLISEMSSFIIGVFLVISILKKNYKFDNFNFKNIYSNKNDLLNIFKINSNIFIRSLLLITTFAWFTNNGAKQGELILAANEILLLMLLFLSYALDGFAQAAEMLVGKAIGEKNLHDFNKCIKLTSNWAFIFALIFSFSYFAFGKVIINTLTDLQSVRDYAYIYLPWMIFLPLIGVWSYQLDGIFIGATQTKYMRDTMFVALLVFAIGVFILIPKYENNGLWISFTLFLLTRALGLYSKLPKLKEAFN